MRCAGRPTDRRDVLRLVVRSAVDVGRPTLYAMLIIIAALMPVFTLQSVEDAFSGLWRSLYPLP